MLFASVALAALLFFLNESIVVSSLADKFMEIIMISSLLFVVFIAAYFLLLLAKSGAGRVANRNKKDLTK